MHSIPLIRAGLVVLLTATTSTLTVGVLPASAATPTMTLSSTSGPSGGGNTLTGSISTTGGNPLAFPAGTSPVVQFQYNGPNATMCRPNAQDVTATTGTASSLTGGVVMVAPSGVRRISTSKIALTVPVDLVLLDGQTVSRWNLCVYNNDSTTTSTLLATATYTLALRPVITAILPARSPAAGGQTITVNGAGFGPGTTATIDGMPVTDVVLAATGDSFSATTPAHGTGTGYWVVVRTAGGVVSSFDPDNNGLPEDGDSATADASIPFTFDNSITINPNSAPANSSVYLDVRGADFGDLPFDETGTAVPTDPVAHVFLVHDVYDSTANRGVQECVDVIVLDDTELVCRLDLAADSLDPATSEPQSGIPVALGTYTITVVGDGSIGASAGQAAATELTSGATFTVAPY